jgi:hypothetical protein
LASAIGAPLATLLAAGVLIAVALLAAANLRLICLPAATASGALRRLIDPTHVVAVLNHELAAEAVFVVSNLWHKNSSLLLRTASANLKGIETLSVQCLRGQGFLLQSACQTIGIQYSIRRSEL